MALDNKKFKMRLVAALLMGAAVLALGSCGGKDGTSGSAKPQSQPKAQAQDGQAAKGGQKDAKSNEQRADAKALANANEAEAKAGSQDKPADVPGAKTPEQASEGYMAALHDEDVEKALSLVSTKPGPNSKEVEARLKASMDESIGYFKKYEIENGCSDFKHERTYLTEDGAHALVLMRGKCRNPSSDNAYRFNVNEQEGGAWKIEGYYRTKE